MEERQSAGRVMRQGGAPRRAHPSIRFGVLGAVMSLALVLGLLGGTSAASSLGTASFSAAEGGGVHIRWNASCDLLDYWAVNVQVTYPNGDRANGSGYVFNNHGGADPNESDDGNWAVLLPQGTSETVQAQVTVECPNGSADVVIGEAAVTLGSGSRSRGSGSGGSGSGGPGNGGTGPGGSGSGTGGSGATGGGSGSGGPASGGSKSHCVVPKLAGKTLTAARKLLKHAHCTLGAITRPTGPPGATLLVRSSTPRAGTHLREGAKVNVKLRKP